MIPKKVSRAILTIAWELIAALYIFILIFHHGYQNWSYQSAQYDTKVLAGQDANFLVRMYYPYDNLVCIPILKSFSDTANIAAFDNIPKLPEPFGQFMYLLRGYKIGDKFSYFSPWFPEEKLPKTLMEYALTRPKSSPLFSPKDGHFSCGIQNKRRNDTLFFLVRLTDCDRRDSILPKLFEEALRVPYYREEYYPTLPTPQLDWRYIEVTRGDKLLYRNRAFDKTKVHLVYNDEEGASFSYSNTAVHMQIYSTNDTYKTQHDKLDRHLWRAEWNLFVLYTLGLVMLLRGDSIRDGIVGWWRKRKVNQ